MTAKQDLKYRRELWIKALESGKYRQGDHELGGPQIGYCCLGVACVVYEKETGEELPKMHYGGTYTDTTLSGKQDFVNVAEWYGITGVKVTEEASSVREAPKKRSLQSYLMVLNDQEERSFQEIADYLKTVFIELEKENEKTD